MYVEERVYPLEAGTVPEYLKHYENEGMAALLSHLPHTVAAVR